MKTNKLVKQDLLLTKPCWELLIRLCLCRCSIMNHDSLIDLCEHEHAENTASCTSTAAQLTSFRTHAPFHINTLIINHFFTLSLHAWNSPVCLTNSLHRRTPVFFSELLSTTRTVFLSQLVSCFEFFFQDAQHAIATTCRLWREQTMNAWKNTWEIFACGWIAQRPGCLHAKEHLDIPTVSYQFSMWNFWSTTYSGSFKMW